MFFNNKSSLIVIAENTCLMNDILSQHWVSLMWSIWAGNSIEFMPKIKFHIDE
jgi:hypothetical protein